MDVGAEHDAGPVLGLWGQERPWLPGRTLLPGGQRSRWAHLASRSRGGRGSLAQGSSEARPVPAGTVLGRQRGFTALPRLLDQTLRARAPQAPSDATR